MPLRVLTRCCCAAQVKPVALSASAKRHKLVYSKQEYHELMATLDGSCEHYRAPA